MEAATAGVALTEHPLFIILILWLLVTGIGLVVNGRGLFVALGDRRNSDDRLMWMIYTENVRHETTRLVSQVALCGLGIARLFYAPSDSVIVYAMIESFTIIVLSGLIALASFADERERKLMEKLAEDNNHEEGA